MHSNQVLILMPKKVKVIQSCLTLCNPVDYSMPTSSGLGISRQNTELGCHSHLQGVFLTHGLSLGLLRCRQISLLSEPPGKPNAKEGNT